MEKTEIIAGVASELYATEAAIDAAIAQATTLVQALVASRAPLNASAVAGAQSQTKMIESIAALGQAREAIIGAHAELARDHRRMGWGVFAAGPVDKPDYEDGRGPKKTSHLTQVTDVGARVA